MNLSDALSKLHEILRVLIGECADEWQSQKPISKYKTDCEWVQHLLQTHKACCNDDECLSHCHQATTLQVSESNHKVADDQFFGSKLSRTIHKLKRKRFRPKFHRLAGKSSGVVVKTELPDSKLASTASSSHSIGDSVNISKSLRKENFNDSEEQLQESSDQRLKIKTETDDIITLMSDDDDGNNKSPEAESSADPLVNYELVPQDTMEPGPSWGDQSYAPDNSYTVFVGDNSWRVTDVIGENVDHSPNEYQYDKVQVKEEVENLPEDSAVETGDMSYVGGRYVSSHQNDMLRYHQLFNRFPKDDYRVNRYLPVYMPGIAPVKRRTMKMSKSHDLLYKCDLCEKSFNNPGTLFNHKKIHNARTRQCVVCGWTSQSLQTMQNHVRRHVYSGYIVDAPGYKHVD